MYNNKKSGWEQFFIDSVEVHWVPSNYVGTTMYDQVSQNTTSTAVSPIEMWEDIDSLAAVNYNNAARLSSPNFNIFDPKVGKSWRRSCNSLY